MKVDLFSVTTDQLRAELAADLSRGGYGYQEQVAPDGGGRRYFDKYLVLSRPGLITRADLGRPTPLGSGVGGGPRRHRGMERQRSL